MALERKHFQMETAMKESFLKTIIKEKESIYMQMGITTMDNFWITDLMDMEFSLD
jgi:hypothetical protein